ncbi:unnamed protein product [Rhizophagus irregularis]|nr:unnamed protein product [Rhizophagus irregularis]CAB5396456.1 unnamed protein product [Rhizophagus irregularis]
MSLNANFSFEFSELQDLLETLQNFFFEPSGNFQTWYSGKSFAFGFPWTRHFGDQVHQISRRPVPRIPLDMNFGKFFGSEISVFAPEPLDGLEFDGWILNSVIDLLTSCEKQLDFLT